MKNFLLESSHLNEDHLNFEGAYPWRLILCVNQRWLRDTCCDAPLNSQLPNFYVEVRLDWLKNNLNRRKLLFYTLPQLLRKVKILLSFVLGDSLVVLAISTLEKLKTQLTSARWRS